MIARVAKDLEQERISFAGTRGKKKIIGGNWNRTIGIISRDSGASYLQASGIGTILADAGAKETAIEERFRIRKTANRGIGNG
jgi:hypothetical protein